jgi:peptide/nickel transport system substrate-binding protein
MQRKSLYAVTSAVAVLFLVACSPSEVPEDEGPTGRVRFLIAENFWADWSPYQSTAQSQFRLERQIYDTLVDFPTGDLASPEPMLATSWEQIDGRTWEFTLRDDVAFHDGQQFTAEDVKASIELASGATDVETVLAGRWVPTTVEVVDDHTARLTTEVPFAPLLSVLRQTSIISAEYQAEGQEALAERPNGTGPFKLREETETRKVMEANLDYWAGPPQVQELVWEFVGDAQTRVDALLAGDAHAVDRVPPEQLARIEQADGYSLASFTATEQVNLWVRPGRLPTWDESLPLRRAVMLAINRTELAENLVLGHSVAAASFLPSQTLFYSAGSPPYDQDLEEAARLVAEAGAVGTEFELWVATGFLPRAEQVVQVIEQNLRDIGLEPQVVTTDVAGMIDDIFSDDGTGAFYHLSWSNAGDPHLAAEVYSDAFVWSVGTEEFEDLLAQGLSTLDPVEREQVYVDLQAHLWERLPHVPLYYSDFTVAYSDRLEGVRILPNYETYFYPARLVEQ